MKRVSRQRHLICRFTIGGVLFGCCFPLSAWCLDLRLNGLAPTFASLVGLHRTNPLHWIVEMAPMVLGMAFYLIGVRQARIEDLIRDLSDKVVERTAHLEAAAGQLREREEQLKDANAALEREVDLHVRENQHQATHDPLTGLPNRSLFTHKLGRALAGAIGDESLVAVLHIDLDHFRLINDSLGHESGDQLLTTIADRLQEAAGPSTLVARLGGDEFAVLLDAGATEELACAVAGNLLASITIPVELGGHEYYPTASIGVSLGTGPAYELARLLRHADTAMHTAKEAGSAGYALYQPFMSQHALLRVDLEAALRIALVNEELRVYYQPLIDLSTGQIAGFEALVRWDRPGHGIVSPGEFVPLAEESGQIVPIGWWVMREACAQAKAWVDAYPDMGMVMNVNLSGRQLQRPDMVDQVAAILEETGLAPSSLKLEITESVLMADGAAAVATLRELRSLGVKLALDDFGTGYSSMAMLHAYPIDTVKIDRAFIGRLEEDEEATALVAAIMLMARSLGIDVTGEGIENATQVAQLQELRCDVGQGYYFARPLPAAEAGAMLSQRSPAPIDFYRPTDCAEIEDLLEAVYEQARAA